jgi:hypothetical protein
MSLKFPGLDVEGDLAVTLPAEDKQEEQNGG